MVLNNYAVIDADGICVGVSQLAGDVDAPDLVEIESFDETLIGKRRSGKKWVAVEGPARDAEREAEDIERETGMSGDMRSILIAIAEKLGVDVSDLKGRDKRARDARERARAARRAGGGGKGGKGGKGVA
jgi:hypothetical protein